MRIANKLSTLALAATFGCGTSEKSGDVEQLACVAEALPDIEITLELPPEEVSHGVSFQGPCTVQSVGDMPLSLGMSCDGSPAAFDVTLGVTGASGVSWSSELPVGSAVDLRYATIGNVFRSPAWVTVRLAGESDPSLVAVKSWQPLPWFEEAPDFMTPLELEFLGDTDCVETKGSCNEGPRRRAAVQLTVGGEDSAIVFDHNEGNVSAHQVRVGEAEVDEGNCEGVSETWYEVLITRESAP